ncbi:neutral/alkaline non-lysosomal ceramidase N-terminal domain-containing protein [Planctomyces sp. SH-PL14]|uniref:neutral/alkaline non-lysosomal ceramidase N-terminal domain-containing protein n=1 Tax=Planctomyces sp. SH-PL14 TaxID=1632864 RepID=UPI00078DA56F|nr:neutral/alkaline non-lysosomal ceramidase N-terminal domain-containing protein [Planctomyces sp. SH-PL14]AMV21622.1 Neutral ceramidase [Planctomyces sp. SH-PL14]
MLRLLETSMRTVLLVAITFWTPSVMDAGWKAGLARVDITPAGSMWMAGYAARTTPSEGVEQPLFAKALVLADDSGTQIAIVTLDLIGIPRWLREDLASEASKKYGIAPEHLLLNASHTHCGPELREPLDSDTVNAAQRGAQAREYSQGLYAKLVALIGEAQKALQPAKVGYSHARCGFAMNRRLPTANGYQNSPNPDGPVDHDVPVLRIASEDGKTVRGLLFGYACHNTTLGFQKFCGDYAGYAQEYLEADHPGVQAMFVLGCGGDQNPYPRKTLELAQRHGRSLATAVETALETPFTDLTGSFKGAIQEAALPYEPIPSREEFEKRAGGKSTLEAQHARRMLKRLDEMGSLPASYPYLVQVLRLGDQLTLVGLSGEVVVDYSFRLQRDLKSQLRPGERLWIAGYSNDVFGYVPSARVLAEGGYEPYSSMLYGSRPASFAPEAEEVIVGRVLDIRRRLSDGSAR